jgi:hypothetical protein
MAAEIKSLLGYSKRTPAKKILADWKTITSRVCKPCWEIKYCPYGPLVEQFPLLPPDRDWARKDLEYKKECLATGLMFNGTLLNKTQREHYEKDVSEFDARKYPEAPPKAIADASCSVFSHMCPVFFSAEPFTETRKFRKLSRSIPRAEMLKIVRPDGTVRFAKAVAVLYQTTKWSLTMSSPTRREVSRLRRTCACSVSPATGRRATH